MGNDPGAIVQGGNCPWGNCLVGNYLRRVLWGRQLSGGYLSEGQFVFQVISPSNTLTISNILMNCSLPVLIYEYY